MDYRITSDIRALSYCQSGAALQCINAHVKCGIQLQK